MSQDTKTVDDPQLDGEPTSEKDGVERRVSLSITVLPSTRARLELAAVRNHNTISRLAEMAMLEWLDEDEPETEAEGKKKKKQKKQEH